jgi:hypothetical protein
MFATANTVQNLAKSGGGGLHVGTTTADVLNFFTNNQIRGGFTADGYLRGLKTPVDPADAATKGWVEGAISAGLAWTNLIPVNGWTVDGTYPAQACRDEKGRIYLRGQMNAPAGSGSAPRGFCALPSQAGALTRPYMVTATYQSASGQYYQPMTVAFAGNGYAAADGSVAPALGSFLILDGIVLF